MHARYGVGTGTIDVYFDKNAFDLLPLANEEKERSKFFNLLAERICAGMAQNNLGNGRIAQTFHINNVLITPEHIQIIYLDDTSSPRTLNLNRKPEAPNFFNYKGIVTELTHDVHLIYNIKKRKTDLEKLKQEQYQLARKNFLEKPVFDPPTPLSPDSLFKKNWNHVVSQSQHHFAAVNQEKKAVDELAKGKLVQLQQFSNNLEDQTRNHTSNLVSFIAPVNSTSLPTNANDLVFAYTTEANQKLQREAKTQQQALDKLASTINDRITQLNEVITKEQEDYLRQQRNILETKVKIIHAMHLAAQEAFDIIRATPPAEREAARLKFNAIYNGFAEVSEIGKLTYQETFLHKPFAALSQINTALVTAEPNLAERAKGLLVGQSTLNHLQILQKHLGNLDRLTKVEDTRLHIHTSAYEMEQTANENLPVRINAIQKAAQEAKNGLAIDTTKQIETFTKRIDSTAKDISQSQKLFLDYLRLDHRAQQTMREAEDALGVVKEIYDYAQKLKTDLEKELPQNNAMVAEILPLVKEIEENYAKIKTLADKMREQDRDIRNRISGQSANSDNISNFANTMGELNSVLDDSFNKNKVSVVFLYNKTTAIEERLKIYEDNLLFYRNLNNIDQLIVSLEKGLETLDQRGKTANEGLEALRKLHEGGYHIEHDHIVAGINSTVEIETSITLIKSKIESIKILRQEYADELHRPNIDKNNREEHVTHLDKKLNQIKSAQASITTHSTKIEKEQKNIEKLYSKADTQNQPIFIFTSNLLNAIYNIDFWKDQVKLLGGSKLADTNIRVPTGIARMFNAIERTEKKYPHWHTNPNNISIVIQALQKIAKERLEKYSNAKFKLFSKNNVEDKDSIKFYKMLAELDLNQLTNDKYTNEALKKLEHFLPQKTQPQISP